MIFLFIQWFSLCLLKNFWLWIYSCPYSLSHKGTYHSQWYICWKEFPYTLKNDWCGHLHPSLLWLMFFWLHSLFANAGTLHLLLLSCMFWELSCFCPAFNTFLSAACVVRLHLICLLVCKYEFCRKVVHIAPDSLLGHKYSYFHFLFFKW